MLKPENFKKRECLAEMDLLYMLNKLVKANKGIPEHFKT